MMQEQQAPQNHDGYTNTTAVPVAETKDCKLTDFMGTKDEKAHEELPAVDLEMADSYSSSDEEVKEGSDTRKRKKKGLKDKFKEKMSCPREEDCTNPKDSVVTVEEENGKTTNTEEKKGFLEKMKDKLPGQHKATEEGTTIPPANQEDSTGDDQMKEKKGVLVKIMEKLPGCHKTTDVELEKKDN